MREEDGAGRGRIIPRANTHGGMALAMSMGRPGLGWVAILTKEAIAITTGPQGLLVGTGVPLRERSSAGCFVGVSPSLWVDQPRKTLGCGEGTSERNTQTDRRLMAAKAKGAPQKYYAIVGGLNGFTGVARSWYGQAFALTQGVSNCLHKRFNTEAAARDFVASHSGIPADQVNVLHPGFNPVQPDSSDTEEDEAAVAQGRADPIPAAAPQEEKEVVWDPVWREEWLSDLESDDSPFCVTDGKWGDKRQEKLRLSFEEFCEVFDIRLDSEPDVWTRVFNYFHRQGGGVDEQGQQ